MLTAARWSLALLTLAAIAQQLVLHIGASFSVPNFFSYFTNLSNLFAAGVLLFVAPGRSASRDLVRFVSAVNMAVVGLVFAVLLRNTDLGSLLPWVNFVLHTVMPVAVVLDWLVCPPSAKLRGKHIALAMVFPLVYLSYVVLRGAHTGWYPYPFLDPVNVGGYTGVAAYALGIAVTFVLCSAALLAGGNRRVRSSAQPADR